MDINTSNTTNPGMSVLARANEQPKLAQQLLEKTVDGTSKLKVDEANRAELASFTGKGQFINTTA
ncbi:MAG: hypothetical protein RBR22_05345 [Desulfuromonas sp.]|nr:hypothetical protein [Desulfuromonas sp.]